MIRYTITALIALMAFSLKAQLTEEDNTHVLDKERGAPIFELKAGVEVYSFEPEEGWYRIRREVFVDAGVVDKDGIIAKDTELLNADDEVIGRTITEVKVVEGKQINKARGKRAYQAIIEGYLFKTKLADGTAPEDWVSRILENKNRTQQVEEFNELYETYEFEERKFDEFTVRVMRENHKNIAKEKDFRLIIVFRGETPYGIITNDHNNVSASKVKLRGEEDSFTILYFYKPPAAQQELIENTILYTYLAL